MEGIQALTLMTRSQDEFVNRAVKEHGNRLFGFIRNRVDDLSEAEDILQDVYVELTSLVRLDRSVEQVAAWLFRVARNKIIDRYRKTRTVSLDAAEHTEGEESSNRFLDELADLGSDPERSMDTGLLMLAVEEALDELPPEQRDVFLQHEMEGKSFRDIAATAGVPVNTLLSRKRYAVLHLRRRLQDLYDEMFND